MCHNISFALYSDLVMTLSSPPAALFQPPGWGIVWLLSKGLPYMTSAKISDFFTPSPLVRKFTQPPLLRLLTMSAFEGTPSPLSADVIHGSPLALTQNSTIILHRLLQFDSKKNLAILTSVLTMLTIIPPLVCIHPVVIWSQDSNSQSGFPLLVVLVWFLPLLAHLLDTTAVRYLRPLCTGIENFDATHRDLDI